MVPFGDDIFGDVGQTFHNSEALGQVLSKLIPRHIICGNTYLRIVTVFPK